MIDVRGDLLDMAEMHVLIIATVVAAPFVHSWTIDRPAGTTTPGGSPLKKPISSIQTDSRSLTREQPRCRPGLHREPDCLARRHRP